jgi:hypothetical protein
MAATWVGYQRARLEMARNVLATSKVHTKVFCKGPTQIPPLYGEPPPWLAMVLRRSSIREAPESASVSKPVHNRSRVPSAFSPLPHTMAKLALGLYIAFGHGCRCRKVLFAMLFNR